MRSLSFIILLIFLASCGDGSTSRKAVAPTILPVSSELEPGTYFIDCFLNRLVTLESGSNIYSKFTVTIEENNTGSIAYNHYSDASCTQVGLSGTDIIRSYELDVVDRGPVLVIDQAQGDETVRIWIPYQQVSGEFYLDLDYSDGQSGGYITSPPTFEDMKEFLGDPTSQGLLLRRI